MTSVLLRCFWPTVILVSSYAYGSGVKTVDLSPAGQRSAPILAAGDLSGGAAENSGVKYVAGESLEPLYDFLIGLRLHKLCKLLREAHLEDILLDTGPLTIFAPTDGSFVFLPGGTLEETRRNPQWLRDFLLHHIVAGDLSSQKIQDELVVTSLQGAPLRFNIYGSGQVYTVSGSQIVSFDLPFELGRLHIIDHPIYPIPERNIIGYLQPTHSQLYRLLLFTGLPELLSGGTYTIFAPDDKAFGYLSQNFLDILNRNKTLAERILLNHVLHGSIYTRGITNGMQLESVGGGLLTFTESRGLTFVNGVPIVSPDIPVMNGVVHIINRVLLPEDIDADCHCKSTRDGSISSVPRDPTRRGGSGQPQTPGTELTRRPVGQPGTPDSPYGTGRPGTSIGTGSDARPTSPHRTPGSGRPSVGGQGQIPGSPFTGSQTQRPGSPQRGRPGSPDSGGQTPEDQVLPQDHETQQIPGDNFVSRQPQAPGSTFGTGQAQRPGIPVGTGQPHAPGSSFGGRQPQVPGSPFGTGQPQTPETAFGTGSAQRPGSSFAAGQQQAPDRTFGPGSSRRPGSSPEAEQQQSPDSDFGTRPVKRPDGSIGTDQQQPSDDAFDTETGRRPGSSFGTGQPQTPGTGQRPGSSSGTGQPQTPGTGQRPGSSFGTGQRPGSSFGTGQRPGSSFGAGQPQIPETGQRPGSSFGTGQPHVPGTGQRPGSSFGTGQPQTPGTGFGIGQRPGSSFGTGQQQTQGAGFGEQRPDNSFGTEQSEVPGSTFVTGQRPGSHVTKGQPQRGGQGQRPQGTSQPRYPQSPGSRIREPQRPESGIKEPQRPGDETGASQQPGSGLPQRPDISGGTGQPGRPGGAVGHPQRPGSPAGTGHPGRPGTTAGQSQRPVSPVGTGQPGSPGSTVGQPQRPGSAVGTEEPQRPGSAIGTGQPGRPGSVSGHQQRPQKVAETEYPEDESGEQQIPGSTFETGQPDRVGSLTPDEKPGAPGGTKTSQPGRIPLPPPPTRAPTPSRTRTTRYPGSHQRGTPGSLAPGDETKFGGSPGGTTRGPYRPTRGPPTSASHATRYPRPDTQSRVTPTRSPHVSSAYPDAQQEQFPGLPGQTLQPGRTDSRKQPSTQRPQTQPGRHQPATDRPSTGQLRPVPTRAPVSRPGSRPVPQPNCRQPGDRITSSNRNFALCSTQDVSEEPCQSLDRPYDPSDPRPACADTDSSPQGCRNALEPPGLNDRRPVCRIPQRKPSCRKYNEPRDGRPLCTGSSRNCRLPEEPENPSNPLPVCQDVVSVEGCRRPDEPYDPRDRRPECPPDDCRPPQEPLRPGDTRPLCTVNEEESIRQPLVPTTAKPRYPQQPKPGSQPEGTPGIGQSRPGKQPSQDVSSVGSRPQTPSWQGPQTQPQGPRQPARTESHTTRKPGKQPQISPIDSSGLSPDDNDALISPGAYPPGRPGYPASSQDTRRQGQPSPAIDEPSHPQVQDHSQPGRPHSASQRPSSHPGISQRPGSQGGYPGQPGVPQRPGSQSEYPHSEAQGPSGQPGTPQRPEPQGGYPSQPGRPQRPGSQSEYPSQPGIPQRPGSQGGYPGQPGVPQRPGSQSEYPHSEAQGPSGQPGTPQRPEPQGGYPSEPGRPQRPGTQSEYPSQPGRPQKPGSESEYPSQPGIPQKPVSQGGYPGQPGVPQRPGSQGGYPGQPGIPQRPGSQSGYPHGSQGGYPGQPGAPQRPGSQGGYPGQPGIPQRPGSQSEYPHSEAQGPSGQPDTPQRPGSQGGYPGQPGIPQRPGSQSGYPHSEAQGPSGQPGTPQRPGSPGGYPGQPGIPERPGSQSEYPHSEAQEPSGEPGTPQRPESQGRYPSQPGIPQRPGSQGGYPSQPGIPQRPGSQSGYPHSGTQRPSGQPGIPQTTPQRPGSQSGYPHSGAQRPPSPSGGSYPGSRPATVHQQPHAGSQPSSSPGSSTGDDSARSLLNIVRDPGLQIKGHPVKLTIVLDLFEKAGLVHILEGPGPATAFLPSDDAFKKLPRGVVEQLRENPELLQRVLLYHVIAREIRPSAQESSITVPTLQGMSLVITMLKEGRLILIGGAKAVAVTRASNGIFYVINELLYPLPHEDIVSALKSRPDLTQVTSLVQRSGLTQMLKGPNPFTLFAPTDAAFANLPDSTLQAITQNSTAIQELLLGHIVDGAHFGREFLAGGVFPNARGGKLRFKVLSYGYTVNDANIKTPEIVTGSGVIHLVDEVLLEPEDLQSLQEQPQVVPVGGANVVRVDVTDHYENYPEIAELARGMGLNKFLSWITNTGLIERVHDGGSYTILAPTDAAVSSLPDNMIQAIDTDPDQVRPLLKFHIITQHVDLNSVRNEQTVATLLPDKKIRFNLIRDGPEQIVTACGVPITQPQGSGSVRLVPVNQPLYPPTGSLAQVIEASPILQNLAKTIRTFHLTWMFTGQGPTTIFAPSDAAFEALSDEDKRNLIENRQAFTELLKRHLVKGSLYSNGMQDGMQVRNDNRETLTFSVYPGGISVNSIPISYSDVTATNGVLHVIDHFL